jgi:hypothetical protein
MLAETIQLETLRQRIEDAEYQAGDRSDFLDRGKPSAAQAKEARQLIDTLMSQSKSLKEELKQLIAAVRSQQPLAFEEWINLHTAILRKIIDEQDTSANAKTRKLIAKNTLQEWEKVRAGEQDYVGINWYFLKDYRERVRKMDARSGMAATNTTPTKNGKAWWQFWK